MTTAIVWFRRDFRIADNPALSAACAEHRRIVPVYIYAPDEEAPWHPGAASRWWLHYSLLQLSETLAGLGAPLIIRQGATLPTLRAVLAATGARAIYWNRLYEPALTVRDTEIKQQLRDAGVAAHSFNGALLAEPWEITTGGGTPYRVFTPFWRNAGARPCRALLPPPTQIKAAARIPDSTPLQALALRPEIGWDSGLRASWTPGERGAWAATESFFADKIARYRDARDFPEAAATSRLSPHLHFGEIGPMQLLARAQRANNSALTPGLSAAAEAFIRQVGWREFAHHLLFHFPTTPEQPLQPQFDHFPWRSRAEARTDLAAWQRGRTGVPIVDAGMRELWHTGWMHNRVRMIAASFLTKNLLIPWQNGARWFWDTLVDASLANNTLGWQWVAGCGADAAPYFRIFNPILQSQKFDADGAYLRRWLPERGGHSIAALHTPSAATPSELQQTAYPSPIVDLARSRERALTAYARIKGAS